MYIRITPVKWDPAREQEAERVTNEVAAAMSKAPGFRHRYSARDRASDRGYSISLWETREQAEGLRDVLGSQIIRDIGGSGIQLGDPQIMEVTAEA